MINSPSGHQSIYNAKARVTKGIFYKVWPRKTSHPNTWDCVDNSMHARKRHVLHYVFSENAMRSAETFVIQHVNRWCELLGENNAWSRPRNMADWTDRLVFDILVDLCFGESMEIKEPGESELKKVPHLIDIVMKTFNYVR